MPMTPLELNWAIFLATAHGWIWKDWAWQHRLGCFLCSRLLAMVWLENRWLGKSLDNVSTTFWQRCWCIRVLHDTYRSLLPVCWQLQWPLPVPLVSSGQRSKVNSTWMWACSECEEPLITAIASDSSAAPPWGCCIGALPVTASPR